MNQLANAPVLLYYQTGTGKAIRLFPCPNAVLTNQPPAFYCRTHMKAVLDRIRKLKVMVMGDIILDHYVWGNVTRISPEAPVPVVEIYKETYTAGGAANVAANVRSLGAGAEVCGWIGDDDAGRHLLEVLDDLDVAFHKNLFLTKRPTIRKTRVMAQRQQL